MQNRSLKTRFRPFGLLLFVFFIPVVSLFILSESKGSNPRSADALPSAEDINNLARTAELAATAFMQDSQRSRTEYQCLGRFCSLQTKENLQQIAKKVGDELDKIAKNQQTLKQQIEDYTGSDWEEKYGSTGLWRKLSADLYITTLSKCGIDFYIALASDESQKNEILHRTLSLLDSLDANYRSADAQFLKARIFAILSQSEPACKQPAINLLNSLMLRSDMRQSVALRAAIEKIKLAGEDKPGQLDMLAEMIIKSDCANDPELILSLEFLQRRIDPNGFEKTVRRRPQTEDFLSELILSDLACRTAAGQLTEQDLRQISVFEAELAAKAAWKDAAENHNRFDKPTVNAMLDRFTETEKFRTPLILYVAAVKSGLSPAAVGLLTEAARRQYRQKSENLDIEPSEIAGQAAQLAYNLLAASDTNSPAKEKCQSAMDAFSVYQTTANEKMDEDLEYLYIAALSSCGYGEKSMELLQKIAGRPGGKWRDKAALELLAYRIRQNQYGDKNQKVELLRQFSSLITNDNDCKYAGEAIQLSAEIIDNIEEFQTGDSNFAQITEDCKKLANVSYGCLKNQQAGLILAEADVLAAQKERGKLAAVEELIDDLIKDAGGNNEDLLRCQARLAAEQGRFDQASQLWSEICRIQKSETQPTEGRSRRWWQAKFYELDCLTMQPKTNKENILHTIEVLQSSFADVPPLWAKKIDELKERCRKSPADAGK